MSVSQKIQSELLKGQIGLRAKCRYCGNAWFPFAQKSSSSSFATPFDALVKCPKCKSKQHLHWIGKTDSQMPEPLQLPNLKGVNFETIKKVAEEEEPSSKIETATEIVATTTPHIQEPKQNAPEIAPLPELKESTQKIDPRPMPSLFKSKSNNSSARPIFKASSKFGSRPISPKAPEQQQAPASTEASHPKPESKPEAPAPTVEIKIGDDAKPREDGRRDVEEIEPRIEIRRDFPRQSPPPLEKHEEVSTEPKIAAVPATEEAKKAGEDIKKPQETKPEPKPSSMFGARAGRETLDSRPKSMFKSSLFKSPSQGPRPMFRSQLKRDTQESRPPQVAPEANHAQEGTTVDNSIPAIEQRKPVRTRKRESLFAQKKPEVEVRESPLDDEPQEKVTAHEAPHSASSQQDDEPKPIFSSGWGGSSRKAKPRKKAAEESSDLEENSEGI